jgi:pantoate--beta-alanine ligase
MNPARPLLISGVREMQAWSRENRAAGRSLGFVPTMGGLHEGHLSLMRLAAQNSDRLVVSIFVNPTQFRADEDYHSYPRDLKRDLGLLEEVGADVCFFPDAVEIYPPGDETRIDIGWGTDLLCGSVRPGHFDGVVNILVRLFNAVLPDEAVFGQKDAQQALIVRRLVRALHFPLRLCLGEIVREPDGLAMSSRNAYLDPEERERAFALRVALDEVGESLRAGERDPERLRELGEARIVAIAGAMPEYFSLVEPETLQMPSRIGTGLILVACALRFSKARLIDNHVYFCEGEAAREALLF